MGIDTEEIIIHVACATIHSDTDPTLHITPLATQLEHTFILHRSGEPH